MKKLITSPARVYLLMALFALLGIWASQRLPVSMFPNTMQPEVGVFMPYGSYSAEEFRRLYGQRIEGDLERINLKGLRVEKIESNYGPSRFFANVTFNWGADAEQAMRETQTVVRSTASTLPEEVRRSLGFWAGGNETYLSMSFYSKKRSLIELHKILEPLLIPQMDRIKDAENVDLWNPSGREIKIELRPQVVASIGLPPRSIEAAIQDALDTQSGGTLESGGRRLPIQMSRTVSSIDDLRHVLVPLPGGRNLPLGDIANIRFQANSQSRHSFKTSGASSLILFAVPKQGGNVKRMAEEIIAVVEAARANFPADVEYRVLVDPSHYIRSAIRNVTFEVMLGSVLASLVLFLFIGNLRNVVTTAIEIPISIALAFIMMWIFDININLLSLAGLALAAGMNVDASVVVMENIFRHLEERNGPLTAEGKLKAILAAVDEVKIPVIASTLASLVVFVPFMFISGLSYAILGDLAKAVIFSHGFSAIVALILVPTVRLHLLKNETAFTPKAAPIDFLLIRFESFYLKALDRFMHRPAFIGGSLLAIALGLGLLAVFVLPRLPKEVIGKPETDWLAFNVRAPGNTNLRQMEGMVEKLEREVLQEVDADILYTFDNINGPNDATILARIRDKSRLPKLKILLEEKIRDRPEMQIHISQWNPSEFQIPDPPHLRVAISGGEPSDRLIAARSLKQRLEGQQGLTRIWTDPDISADASVRIIPHREQWNLLSQKGMRWTPDQVTDALRIATQGKWIGELAVDGTTTPIVLRYPEGSFQSIEDIGAYPISFQDQLLPLRAIATVERQSDQQNIHTEGGRELNLVWASKADDAGPEAVKAAENQVRDWISKELPTLALKPLAVQIEDPHQELTTSLNQLTLAFAWSIALIFLTIVLQFGSLAEATIVLVAVPLGILGAVASLFLFGSTLSVNSALGMILLNGIAVNNSIILVDFAKRLSDQGVDPFAACIAAAKQRLRPILITSLTTILGMTPIALGFGAGGRVLQPLGIAVAGGLGVSMLLTLLMVPALQCRWLIHHERKKTGMPLRVPAPLEG